MICAIYKSKEYVCSIVHGGKIINLLNEKPAEGFHKGLSSYVKQVKRTECERIFRKELCFKYKDDSFLVRKQDEKILLETGPRSYNLEGLGFEKISQDTFQKWVDKNDGELYWNETEY